MTKFNCTTCQYGDVDAEDEPCRDCRYELDDDKFTLWTPIKFIPSDEYDPKN